MKHTTTNNVISLKTYDTQKLCGVKTDRGYNMATYSGEPFYPADPRIEDIRIEDIAHGLSRICRFNGHIRDGFEVYSVAQHSLIVCRNLPPELKLEGLLHDAAEAYVGDMIKPIKKMHRGRKQIEDRIDELIRLKFDLPLDMTPEVKRQDYRAFLTEHRDVAPNISDKVDWGLDQAIEKPYKEIIKPMLPSEARRQFLRRFTQLMDDRRARR